MEVRLVTRGNFNSEKSTAGVSDVGGRDEGTETGFKCNNGNEACASVQGINPSLRHTKEHASNMICVNELIFYCTFVPQKMEK